ncbi:HigA family addiction module antitoxin [Synoicihabitans lomoniglobus]|uniref:HigA family addiction module antitoxin n=1 Tax=Synoicihabitans lomoniglobus TaxID=2909285 RepID=A0AAF0A0Q1_9BACT|nr:HigA family addiction module antitoxin [Opitutaceae bacterium LMO-M01]
MKKHLNVHPGELLREEFLSPLGITAYRLAKDAKLPHQRVSEIVNERRGITAETDLHLCAYFGQAPGYWLRVQLAYDLREALNTVGDKIKSDVRPLQAA